MDCATTFKYPKKVRVNRTDFRQNQRESLNKARGSTVVVITGDDADEKIVVDKLYFDEIFQKLKASVETLEVTMDKTLMANIFAATKSLSEDLREGRLLTIDEVFSEE
jgi:hypothetical protein